MWAGDRRLCPGDGLGGVGAGLGGATTDAEADQNLERLLTALREGQEDEVWLTSSFSCIAPRRDPVAPSGRRTISARGGASAG